MKILDAYYDLRLREQLKRYLFAEGKSPGEIDRRYYEFCQYLSRIKHTILHTRLSLCTTEQDFTEMLDQIFNRNWKGHYEYLEMPVYFKRYLKFLHSAIALNPELQIEGIDNTSIDDLLPDKEVTEYALPYIRDGKLHIIANPLLISRLQPLLAKEEDLMKAVEICRNFYAGLLPEMTDNDWIRLIKNLSNPQKRSSDPASCRYIAIVDSEGQRYIMSGNEAFEFLLEKTGPTALTRCNVLHAHEKIVVGAVPPRKKSSFRHIGNGLYLNLQGSAALKAKTLMVVTSALRLGWQIKLTNEMPTGKRK